ncbi:TNT domain-containing protein [Kineosporia sp. J2-2]|uniref:TNT domain-containing protein n=1 Tax=Kineosporia corallincola TaxID=2835133 RepID=A0ABS5TBG6_9ACTN|nr:TNT domain-containing protein [Kineosporia corallincola]MBT0768381.1 TNT domain-containing protein [Kineosporia corallincola]
MQVTSRVFARLRGVWLGAALAGAAVVAGGTALGPAVPAQAAARPQPAAGAQPVVGVLSVAVAQPAAARAATVLLAGKPRSTVCSVDYQDGDRRLGPAQLPNSGTVGYELKGYERTGELTASVFLATYYDSGTGSWIYPPQNGYRLRPDGTPEVWRKSLEVGRELDRFGSEYGGFLSPAGTPYAERAIPPSNLAGTPAEGCNYRRYRVAKEFDVAAGPIAAWFAQRGDGWQYQLAGAYLPGAPAQPNVLWLVDNGYLERVSTT